MVGFESGDTVERDEAEQLRYAPPHWPCTGYYGMERYWISLSHSSSTHCRVFVNHQIELLPWPARFPDLSPIENMWSMAAQRLTQITPPAATPDHLWLLVEAAWSAVPQEYIQSLIESMPRRMAAVISNNGG
ncbi:transposable element Tcb1 transposase [Trichonephila clavipes]|nr:transposable element Tcb1 transposase [Trichonephila clavipes]